MKKKTVTKYAVSGSTTGNEKFGGTQICCYHIAVKAKRKTAIPKSTTICSTITSLGIKSKMKN